MSNKINYRHKDGRVSKMKRQLFIVKGIKILATSESVALQTYVDMFMKDAQPKAPARSKLIIPNRAL